MNVTDTETLNLIRETTRRFVKDQLVPYYEDWENEGIYPREVWTQAGELGLLCADIPEEYGGPGLSVHASLVILEELNHLGMASIAVGFAVHSDIVAHYLLRHGTEEQKQAHLPKMVSGETVGAVLMTEPEAGSDLQGVRATAKLEGGQYVINGTKTFITNGQHAELGIVVARTDSEAKPSRGTSLLLVDLDGEGVERGRNLDKIGIHSADTSELFFENVKVPSSALLGDENRGFYILMNELPRERLSLGVGAIAGARHALDLTLAYVKERKAFGKRVGDFQNTRFELASMETDYRVNKAFADQCTDAYARGELDAVTASMVKLSATECQGRTVDRCLQLFGGYGYMREYPISRAFVDARVQRIYGGTSEIMKELISRQLLDG